MIINSFYKLGGSAQKAGLTRPWASHSSILMYHRVLPDLLAAQDQTGIATSTTLFESHLGYIREYCEPISLSKWYDRQQSHALVNRGKPIVVITFDDGYRDNLQFALPLLEKYQIPATFYITTRFADGDRRMWWYDIEYLVRNRTHFSLDWQNRHFELPARNSREKNCAYNQLRELFVSCAPHEQDRLLISLVGDQSLPEAPETLNWEEIKAMARSPFAEIGAHTVNHPILSRLDHSAARTECLQSKKRLEEKLAIPVNHLAYPFGTQDEAALREYQIAQEVGFQTAVTTISDRLSNQTSLFALPRIAIKRRTTAEHVAVKISGWNNLPIWNGIQI